jgi:hypothetical protein
MSRVLRTTARHAVLGLALAGLTIFAIPAAHAGDFAPPVYGGGAPYGGPVYDRPPVPCRILLERRLDAYGRESVHRIRMCDEGPVYAPAETVAPPDAGYGYPPPRYYGPSPSTYDPYPRPPAPIGAPYGY